MSQAPILRLMTLSVMGAVLLPSQALMSVPITLWLVRYPIALVEPQMIGPVMAGSLA